MSMEVFVVLPELALVGASLVLLLLARRMKTPGLAAAVAVAAALLAMSACVFASSLGAAATLGGLVLDGYGLFFKALFAANLALCALLSTRLVASERVPPAEFNVLLLLAAAGMMITATSLDLVNLYLGLELLSLSSYVLVGITRERPSSNEAAMKYFLLGSFASAILLYGASLVYGLTGATDLSLIARAVADKGLGADPLLLAALGLLAAAFAFKIAAVPFHAWAPDAYEGASAPVAAFMAVGSKAAGFAALGRVCLTAFGPQQYAWSAILVPLAALSMAAGSLLAISQTNVKRMLAYSSISHAGYALLGIIPGTPAGVSATMTYLFIYAFMTLGAFAVVIRLGERGEELGGYAGLAAGRPGTAALMLVFMLSLTGIPPMAGFAAKFAVFSAAVAAGYTPLAVLAVLCSAVSAYFYLRIGVLMYMKEPDREAPAPCPLPVAAALGVAAIATVVIGLFPGILAPMTVPPWSP